MYNTLILSTDRHLRMNTYKFTVSEYQYTQLVRDLKKFNKIARKLNCPEATLFTDSVNSILDPAEVEKRSLDPDDIMWNVPTCNSYDCTLHGTTLIAGDYTFVGSLDHIHARGHVKVYSTSNQQIPKEYHDADAWCNHCEKKRYRSYTFIVKNNLTGEYKQVGSNCLHDFLGHDVKDLIRALKFMVKINDVDFNYEHKGRKKATDVYSAKNILSLTNATIRAFGWAAGNSATHIPTAEVIKTMCVAPHTKEGTFWINKVNEDRRDAGDELSSTAVLKWIENSTSNSSYMSRLRAIVKRDVTTWDFNILCSAIEAFKKEKKAEIEREAMFSQEYVGTVGERLELTLKCDNVRLIDTEYGQTAIHDFVDDDRHVYVWFASNGKKLPVGVTLQVKATVKKHHKYKEQPQTVLTRVTRVEK